jgi:hypothetical protein
MQLHKNITQKKVAALSVIFTSAAVFFGKNHVLLPSTN